MQRALLFAILSLLLHVCVQAQTHTLKYNTLIGDNISGYYEALPASYSTQTSKTYPLFIYIHGFLATGNGSPGQLENIVNAGWGSPPWRSYRGYLPSSFEVNGLQTEYILITPQFFIEPYSNGESSVKDINDLLDYVFSHYRIDQNKVYLTGQSAGAFYVLKYASSSATNAGRITTVVSTSPGGGASPERGNIISAAKLPVWISVAELDIAYEEDLSKEYNEALAWVNDINNATPAPIFGVNFLVLPGLNGHNDAQIATFDPAADLIDGKNIYQWSMQFDKQELLPVSGLEIHANSSHEFINITWKTHTETNNAGFRIERSLNGNKFNQIGFVKSSNAPSGGSYSFRDESPAIGINYYRIVQVDRNGRTSISSVVHANFQAQQSIRVFPNPVRDKLNLTFEGLNKNVIVQIYDNSGSMVKEARAGNQQNTVIDVSSLSKGYYHGSIISEGKTSHFSFVKQ